MTELLFRDDAYMKTCDATVLSINERGGIVLDRTVFGFWTNRRIFRGMIRLADHTTWQAMFDRVLDYSRWDVDDDEVAGWIRHTFDFSIDYLINRKQSPAAYLKSV